jgi:hypothetical protein
MQQSQTEKYVKTISNSRYGEAMPREKKVIGYIRREIPEFEVPPYRGKRYEVMVPDSLDIAERAELAVNGLTGPTDPEADYEIFWTADFFHNPPIIRHDWNDWVQVKFMEALPLLRIVSGSDQNSHVDRAWMEVIFKSIGPDGLFYIPTEGRLWARLNPAWTASPVWRVDGTTTEPLDESVTQFTSPFLCGRIIGAMTIYYLRSKDPVWKETIERMIQRLMQLAVDKGDYCFFPAGIFEPNAKVSPDAEVPKAIWSAESSGGRLIQGLAQYYKVTGYEPARKLAEKLVKCLRYHGEYYSEEGRFLPDRAGEPIGVSAFRPFGRLAFRPCIFMPIQ